MKLVVTILQCRRAVLPHIFVAHIVPQMRALFPGEIECVIVQHRGDASRGGHQLESNKWGQAGLDLVSEWTKQGRYEGADVITHSINHPPYPNIPGLHLCVKAAIERNADFHLWMEDDVLVFDQDCGKWDELMGGTEVGVYRKFHHLNSAYMVTRPSFDERMLPKLADYDWWNWSRRLEPTLRRNMKTRRTHFPMRYAVRYHHRYYPYTGIRYVAEALREWAPEALPLLDVDFGEGTAELPPVTKEEFAMHAAADGAKPIDRFWRIRQRFVERYLLPDRL